MILTGSEPGFFVHPWKKHHTDDGTIKQKDVEEWQVNVRKQTKRSLE